MEYALLGALVLLVLVAAAFMVISNKRKAGQKALDAVAEGKTDRSKAA